MNDSRAAWENAAQRYTIKRAFANGPDLPLVAKLHAGFPDEYAQQFKFPMEGGSFHSNKRCGL